MVRLKSHKLAHQLGRDSEDWVFELLGASPGSRVLCRNYRWRGGEIDLIVEEQSHSEVELVFIEVRARKSGGTISGLESVTFRKQQRIRQTAERFLSKYRGPAQSVRFDVVEREGNNFTHYRNAFS